MGRINSLIYYVDGGMEDWLYAAGWDHDLVQKNCVGFSKSNNKHSRFVGYQMHRKNKYQNRQLLPSDDKPVGGNRALVFLVETSNMKAPHTNTLGKSEALLHPKSPDNGHVPRNLRISLMSIDMVQPYVCFQQIKLVSSPIPAITNDVISSPANNTNSSLANNSNKIVTLGK